MEIPAPSYRDSAQQSLTSIRRAGIHKRRQSMPNFSGSFSGTIGTQTIISVPDKPDHSRSLAGITGGGTFKTKLTSATTLEATWEGAYELASVRAKAV